MSTSVIFDPIRHQDPFIITELGYSLLQLKPSQFGDKLYDAYEQVLLASCDTKQVEISNFCLKALLKKFGDGSERVLCLQARVLEANGEINEAIEIYNEVLGKNPANEMAAKRKVAICISQSKDQEAIVALNSFLDIFSNDESSWQQLALLYIEQKKYDMAKFCIDELLTIAPENYLYHLQCADLLYSISGPCTSARNYYASAYELNPNPLFLRALYGIVLCEDKSSELGKMARKKLSESYSLHCPGLLPYSSVYTS